MTDTQKTFAFHLALLAALLSGCATPQAAAPTPTSNASTASAVQQDPTPALAAASSASAASATSATAVADAAAAVVPTALLEDDLTPGEKINLDTPAAQADLWARLRMGFAIPPQDNELVHRAEAWYSDRPDYVARMTERGGRYMYHILLEVEKRGMPSELALLPFVESAYNPQAMSTAKASGMWQFVPATGRDYALKQNIFRDDRRDVLASTRAALDYLGRLYKQFGDWQLALAAYNWGQGNVAKAIARNQAAGLPTDYESLKMPDETRYYFPKLQAVKNIIMNPAAFGLVLPPMENHPYFLSVNIDRDIDVGRAAALADLSIDEFKQFNPQTNKPVILAVGSSQILLPYANAETFVKGLAAYRGPLATWTAWVVPKTMKPADAAQKVGMSEALLRDVNKIPPKMLVRQGSTLLVPRSAKHEADVPDHLADNASISLAPDLPPQKPQHRLTHRAAKGDTVATVAARYHVTAAQVVQWNKLGGDMARVKPGQQLVVYVPYLAKSAAKSQAKSAPSPKAVTRVAKRSNAGSGKPRVAAVTKVALKS